MLPRHPRAVSDATKARPSRLGRFQGAAKPFRKLLWRPRAVLDAPLAPQVSFGRSRGVPKWIRLS